MNSKLVPGILQYIGSERRRKMSRPWSQRVFCFKSMSALPAMVPTHSCSRIGKWGRQC